MNEKIGIYIDCDNISVKSIDKIMECIKSKGKIIKSNGYNDWNKRGTSKWLEKTKNLGIIPIQSNRIKGKNSTDLKICVDLMEDLYKNKYISMFCIVTSDSDYIHLVSKIKSENKDVIFISNQMNDILNKVCDEYIVIDIDTNKVNREYIKEIDILLEDKESINISIINDILKEKYEFDYKKLGYKNMYNYLSKNYKNIYDLSHSMDGYKIRKPSLSI